MTTDVIDSVLSELGENLFYAILYNWGEPLINKSLPRIVAQMNSYNIFTEVHSNLSLKRSDQFLEDLLLAGIGEITASIDGFTQPVYQQYRKGGDVELAKRNLVRLAELKTRHGLDTRIVWRYLVFSFNESEIDAARSFCSDHGIEFHRSEASCEDPDWLPSYRKPQLGATPERELRKDPAVEKSQPAPNFPRTCSWHYAMSVINANGSISPCCAPWDRSHDLGQVSPNEATFLDTWRGQRYQRARSLFSGNQFDGLGAPTLCEACPYDSGVQNQYMGIERIIVENFVREMDRIAAPLELRQGFNLLPDAEAFRQYCRQNYAW